MRNAYITLFLGGFLLFGLIVALAVILLMPSGCDYSAAVGTQC